MSPLEALAAARAAGVEVRLDGEDLIVSAASEPPDDICAMLSGHKTAIVELLQAAPADAASALAHRARFKEQAAAVLGAGGGGGVWSPEDWLALYDEEAANREFDHGMSRQQAEKHARNFCIGEWLSRNPIDSNPITGCVACGVGNRPNDPLLAIGIAGAGKAWLHHDCVPAWHSSRMDAAGEALAAMGISSKGRPT